MFHRVAEFHSAFGHLISTTPTLPEPPIRRLRHRLIEEELEEYCAAVAANDRIEMADALADLLFVLAGTAVAYGVAPQEPMQSPYDGLPPPQPAEPISSFPSLLRADFEVYELAEEADDLNKITSRLLTMMVDIFAIAWHSAIPINAVFAEVCRSNMSKLGADGKPVVRADGKILKGEFYSPPDIASVLCNV